ncbi:MAG: PAS domain-containing protein [Kangiellaceae bacterium]|nr:PAS domain-containing protein [Kangiellaceae bacterium]
MTIQSSELLKHSPLGILVCDLDGRIDWCNDIFLTITGLTGNSVVGEFFAALPFEAADDQGFEVQLFESSLERSTKFQYWCALSNDKSQTIHYYTCDRKNTDPTNKLNNPQLTKRPNWVEYLNYEVSRSRRYNNPLCILKLQILAQANPDEVSDKAINQTIKDALVDGLRWADMMSATRSGGFLVVLPETPANSIDSLTNKLSSSINSQLKQLSANFEYRLFFGHSCWQKHDDAQLLLARARNALVEELENAR